jgi:tRNA A37 threonylcarbamoyladenosine synthetase subunit TsaC/SUA5/YrdC
LTTTTLLLPGDEQVMTDPVEIRERIGREVDAVIDAGAGGLEPSTVIDLSHDAPVVVRHGAGDARVFEA